MKTWKPTVAGILNIITGALNALSVIGLTIALVSVNTAMFIEEMVPAQDLPFVAPLASTIVLILLVLSVMATVFPIIGGVFALQRIKWGWALAGSIIAILATFPLGVAATIFVAMAKDEFEQASPIEAAQ